MNTTSTIQSCATYGPRRGQPVTFIAGHYARLWYHRPYFSLLTSRGFRIFAFAVEPDVYTSDVDATTTRMTRAATQLCERNNGRPMLGVSLGADLAFMVANSDPSVERIAAIGTGYSFARSGWNHGKLRRSLISDGWSFDALESVWATLGPGNNLTNAADQRFFYSFSTRDSLVGADNSARLARCLTERSSEPVIESGGVPGHFLGCAAGLTAVSSLTSFLQG